VKRDLTLALIIVVAVLATRWPLFENQLFSFDDVNLAYAIGELDVRKSQPHPPGYPLFVMQMRVLDFLRIKRAYSNLQVLSLAGSMAALGLMAFGLRAMMGRGAAAAGAALLALHPVFWYAGLTSALRVQLAVVSLAVAAACWRAQRGDPGWCIRASAILGLGAGIRPELGLVLLPLWAWCVRRQFGRSVMTLAVCGLAWLLPLVMLSGGPAVYVRTTLAYLQDQASLTSGLFGSTGEEWKRAVVWLVTWGFLTLPALTLAGAIAGKIGALRQTWWFFLLWVAPQILFAALVHVADPGQTLGIVAPICAAGGILVGAAVERLLSRGALLLPAAMMLYIPAAGLVGFWTHPRWLVVAICAGGLVTGLLLRWAGQPSSNPVQLGLFVVSPALALHCIAFFYPGWYWQGGILDHVHSALAYSNYNQFRWTVFADHQAIESVRKARAAAPGPVVLVWDGGTLASRKLAYYVPNDPIIVLDRATIRPGSPRAATWIQGPKVLSRRNEADTWQATLQPGTRLIGVLGTGSPLRTLAGCQAPEEPVCVRDF
jgi:hypothetical protein